MSIIIGLDPKERLCTVELNNAGDITVYIKPGIPMGIAIKMMASTVVDLIMENAGKEPSKILPPSNIFTFPGRG